MKLKTIYTSENYYTLCECDRVEGLVIDVTCGGVCMYSRIVELTAGEMEQFYKEGHLDDLACRIGKGDEEILKRQLLPQQDGDKIIYV